MSLSGSSATSSAGDTSGNRTQRLRQTERIGVYDEVVCATCGSAQEGGLEPSPWRLRHGLLQLRQQWQRSTFARRIQLDRSRATFVVTQYDVAGKELIKGKIEAGVAG